MEASQPNERMSSDNGQKFDVFLSHSGKQKNFVRQLYRDLTNQGVSCFFDQDRQSLPLGEDFPPLIFEAAKTCRLAVFLLSKDFLQSKWPMLELSTVVEARDANHHPEILPLFFMISPEALKQIKTLNERWKEIGIDDQRRVKWPQALKAIGRINGLKFSEGGSEVEFRDEIVKEIWRKLPTASPRYHVPYMQGELRMCQKVADFLRDVRPNEKGIIIAGLYGIAGQGKSTLGRAFCNHKLKDFEGKVCHLEFSRGDSFERTKLALQYLIHCHPSYLQDLTKDQAQVELHRRVNGQRVLLVLDNITEESIDEVRYFVKAVFRENSCILLSARSLNVLVKHCKIDPHSCMRVPSLDEDDAIAILLERTSSEELTLGAENKTFALKCANRCSFKEIGCDIGRRGRKFHPLALKAFGGYLFSKYGSTLSKWVAEIDGVVEPSGYGLDGVLAVLDKAFDDMEPKYRTIFMLLIMYIPPNMSLHNVIEWLAISCNEEIEFIVEAVKDLRRKAFIEESEPEIRIHDLYFEFAQSKAKEMGRWLCWKGDEHSTRGFIPHDHAGFELVKLEGCMRRSPSEIVPKFLENLLVLQLVGVQNMNKLDLGQMEGLRSITLHDCKVLSALDGMENLRNLAWLQISGLGKMLKLSKLSSLTGLQHLEIDITVSHLLNQLGDLTPCFRLREIYVRCPSLLEFPRIKGLPYLEKVEFDMCDKVKGPLDCTDCLELQSIVLVGCCQMTASPLLAGCQKLSKIVLSECNAVQQCRDMNLPNALKTLELQTSSWNESATKRLESCYRLESLQLWNMGDLKELPSFRSLSNLTVLKIGKCGISEPPDLTCCVLLEDVYFFTLQCLLRFPNFSLLKKLKKLSLYNCCKVRDPPDISGCHQLRLFYLLYNDSLKGLSKMDKCAQLEEIKVSWHCKDEVLYEGIDPDSCQIDDNLESCLDCFKEVILENLNGVSVPEELEEWMQGKTMLVKKYFRGVKLYYSFTAPYEWDKNSKCYSQNPITLRLVDSKVLAYSTLDRGNEDCGWLDRVRVYFGGRDIARSSAASGKKEEICLSLTPLPRYHVKMWKTKLAKVFCDYNLGKFDLGNFDRKICHLDFFGGDALARQKLAFRHLIQFRSMQVEWVAEEYKALYFFNRAVEGRWVLLVLDNITANSIDQVRYYHLAEGSCTLFTEVSADVRKSSNINSQSFKRLQEEEFLIILIQRTSAPQYRPFALRCTKKCSFREGRGFVPRFHWLALRAFGRHSSDLSKWFARIDRSGSEHLDALFNTLDYVCLYFHRRRRPRLPAWFYHLERWFAEVDCVDDVFAGLCWLAIMFEKERSNLNGQAIKLDKFKLPKFKKEIKNIKENMSSDRDCEGLAVKCKTAINDIVEEKRLNMGISELHQIIKENYNVADGSDDHTRCIADKDGFEDRLGYLLNEVFDNIDLFPQNIQKWFAERDCVDDVLAGLFWLAKEWEKHVLLLPTKFKKEIKYIREKMSSDEVVKWLLKNCEREIKQKVEDIKHIIHNGFVPTGKKREKEEAWKFVEAMSILLPLTSRYPAPSMQGETRMCQEVADFLNTVNFNRKEIRIVGLYGMSGLGKTTLAKSFSNFSLEFGKVCFMQFGGGNALDRQKHALQCLTEFPTEQLKLITSEDDAQYTLNSFVNGQRVLLVLDNITEDSIDEVRHYLGAEWGKNSSILLIAQRIDVLKNLNIDPEACMHVPRLEEEEAIAILLERMYVNKSSLGTEQRGYALKCANRCSFKENRDSAPTFHPLALKALGRHLFSKHDTDLSKWVVEMDGFTNRAGDGLDGMYIVLEKAFDDMDPRYRRIVVFLATHMPQNKSFDNVVKWVTTNCNEELTYIKEAVKDLYENTFIEEIEPEFRIHDFIKEFVRIKKYNHHVQVDEAKFRDEIVRAISRLFPQKYHVSAMQGEARICQEVADFLNTVHPNERGIRVAGLYGMPGMGKTTIAKSFCNLNFESFYGKVYHLEFALRGHSMDSQNLKLLAKTLQGQRVLLVLDNIQTEESIDIVKYFLQADLGEKSWILISARSVDVLKNFNDIESCMRVPGLEEKEAIAILLERTSLAESSLEAENRGFAVQCANRCSFKEISFNSVRGAHTFHPLALKTFGRHLFSKYGSDLSKWVPELDVLVVGKGVGLDDMFSVLDKVFEDMDPKYQTIFMLLSVYKPPNMSPHKVTEWLAVNCKEEINFIEKAVEDLWQKGFIEEIKLEIRIHDLYIEFAQSKARKMARWLWCKGDLTTSEAEGGLFSEAEEGFELAKLEYCQHQDLSHIGDKYVKNLWALKVVVACKEMSNLGLSSMKNIRSLTLDNCEYLQFLEGMENLLHLAWLQIGNVPKLKVLNLSSLTALQYIEINTSGPTQLGDLTGCVSLREINVRCPSLSEFPRINGLPYLEKAKFKACEEVNGPLDCRACVNLQSIAFENCWQMAHIPLIDGCSNIFKIVLNRCDQVTECSDEDESSALEIVKLCISSEHASATGNSECCDGLNKVPLWNIVISTDVPSLRRFSNLTVLKLYNCDICEAPDVACCGMLEDVCFSTLKNLESFPNFSSLWKLKKLCLCNCQRVRAPPDIGGCYSLQVFHLLYNDNLKALPKMDGWYPLEKSK